MKIEKPGIYLEVPTDASGAMCPTALARCVTEARAAGRTPFFVGATAGTTHASA